MTHTPLIVHERIAHWARQLRPRVAAWPVRLVETRAARELKAAVSGAAWPLVVVDLATRPAAMLGDLGRALACQPAAFVLVLDPQSSPDVSPLARELGAAEVLCGFVPPPRVLELLQRWLRLSQARAEVEGWTIAREYENAGDDPLAVLTQLPPRPAAVRRPAASARP